MEIVAVRNLFWGNMNKLQIRCEVKFNLEENWRPYVLSKSSRMSYSRKAFSEAVSGKYGKIGSLEEGDAHVAKLRRELLTKGLGDLISHIKEIQSNQERYDTLTDDQKNEVNTFLERLEGCYDRVDDVGFTIPMLPSFLI